MPIKLMHLVADELSDDLADGAGGGDTAQQRSTFTMCRVLPFQVTMSARMTMGYCTAALSDAAARVLRLPKGMALRSQQFHYSEATLDGMPAVALDESGRGIGIPTVGEPAYEVCMQIPGASAQPEGAVVCGSTIASYCHMHLSSEPQLAPALVAAARRTFRVASLQPTATEMLAAIVGVERGRHMLVGVSEWCDYPEELVAGVEVISKSVLQLRGRSSKEVESELKRLKESGSSSAHTVNVEWLAVHRPSLCLTQETCEVCDASSESVRGALQAAGLGAERALTLDPRTVQQMLEALGVLGSAIGVAEEAAELRSRLERRLQAVNFVVADIPQHERPRVLGLESVFPLVASGQWLPDMRCRAAAIDALGDSPGAPPRRLELEEVVGCDADVLVICCCGRTASQAADEVAHHLLSHQTFWQMRPMKAIPPRLYVVGHELFSRPGPRLVDGIEQLLALLHPTHTPDHLRIAAADALQLVPNAFELYSKLSKGGSASGESNADVAVDARALFRPVIDAQVCNRRAALMLSQHVTMSYSLPGVGTLDVT